MSSGLPFLAATMALIVMVKAGNPDWVASMNAIDVQCRDKGVSQDPVQFVGFIDECDDNSKVVYAPADSRSHLDMVIDARNSDTVEWDTARYKRYGTYWPTANITWQVPQGFKKFWSRIYYASDSDKKFEPMKYQYSKDGKSWEPVPNVVYDGNVVCVRNNCEWYKRKEESASWDEPRYFFKAIWPAPCAGEVGKTYAADQRVCLSLPPPDWRGTVDEFDASPLKDLYFTPQMSELILGASDLTPERPTNLKLTPALNSIVVTWDPPMTMKEPIIGYSVYYQLESPAFATAGDYSPPYLAKFVNVGLVSTVVLTQLNPKKLVIVRVAAITARGAGPSTLNSWAYPSASGEIGRCLNLVPPPTTAPSNSTVNPSQNEGNRSTQTTQQFVSNTRSVLSSRIPGRSSPSTKSLSSTESKSSGAFFCPALVSVIFAGVIAVQFIM